MAESHLNKFKRLIDANYPAGERYADQKGAARKEDFNALLDELTTKTTERFSVAARGPLIQALTTDGFFESAQGEDSQRLKRIEDVLTAKDTESVALYGMGSTVSQQLLDTVKMTLLRTVDEDVQLTEDNQGKTFTEHNLPKGKHTEEAIKAACTHLQGELTKFGVTFGLNHFEMRPVSTKTLWNNIKLGKFILSGGTDAVIVPGRVDDVSIIRQLRVIIEFKDQEKLDLTNPQCIGELLCGLATSEHMVLVVKTDLKTRFDFWTPAGESYSAWRCSDMKKAMQHISQFLLHCHKEPLWHEVDMNQPLLRAMKRVRTAHDGGVVEDMLSIIPDLPKEERLPYYVQMMYG